MKRATFNRLNMATDLTKRTVCAKCGKPICGHPDPVYSGIIPEIDPAAPVDTSHAVQHRAGLYSDADAETQR